MGSAVKPYDLPTFPPDRFELLELLGEGGTGRVFVARDTHLGRKVALKFLRSGHESEVARIILEARNLAAIRHPNVVPVHEVGLLDHTPCITMDLIEGGNLWETRAELTLTERVELVAQAARGTHAAHRVGLIHRDLKPQNILVERQQQGGWSAHVVDFGLALSTGIVSKGDLREGTPLYMAPEQVMEHGVLDARSDVFSLGAVLYAMVLGQPPFQGPSDAESCEVPRPLTLAISEPLLLEQDGDTLAKSMWTEVFRRLLDEEPVRPRTLDKTIPLDLETIILRALEKEPHRRYPTALALAEDLDHYLAGEPIQARPHSMSYRLGRYYKRNPAVAWATGIALALALASVVVIALLSRRSQQRILLAQRYGALAQEIEQRIRLSHMLPLHDRRPHLAWAQARIQEIRQAANEDGALGQGPLAFLEGVTHLRMNRSELAKVELERAWRLGFRSAAAAEALFEANLDVELSRTQKKNLQKSEEELKTDSRELRLLAQAIKESRSSEASLMEARKAFLEGDMPEALRRCDLVLEQKPWAYEAHLLAGGINLFLANAAPNLLSFRETMDEANARYDRAIALAPSDPKPYFSKANALLQLAHREANVAAGTMNPAPLREALTLCATAEQADPTFARVFALRAHIFNALASFGPDRFDKTRKEALAREATANARKSVILDPEDVYCTEALAWTLQTEVDLAFEGRAPMCLALAQRTEAILWGLIQRHPDRMHLLMVMATNLAIQIALEQEAGLDPRPLSLRAIQIAREAQKVSSRNSEALGSAESALSNLLLRLLVHGDLELNFGNAGAAEKCADETLQILENMPKPKSGASWPDRVRFWAYFVKGEAQVELGIDPGPSLTAVVALEKQLTGLNAVVGRLPRVAPYDRLLLEAELAIRRNQDPRPLLRECFQAATRDLRGDLQEAYGTLYGVLASLVEINYALPRGLDAHDTAAKGLRLSRRFPMLESRVWPDEPKTRLPELGEALFPLAAKGARATPKDFQHAMNGLEAILGQNPHLAHRYRGVRAFLQQRNTLPTGSNP